MTSTPFIVSDNLLRLNCVGPPAKWRWTLYRSPALSRLLSGAHSDETHPSARSFSSCSDLGSRSSERPIENTIASICQNGADFPEQEYKLVPDASSVSPLSRRRGVTESSTIPQKASQRLVAHSPTETLSTSLTSTSNTSLSYGSKKEFSYGRNRASDGIATSGDIPIERFGAALVVLGARRLAVVGGLTVGKGVENSGMVFDEFCVCVFVFRLRSCPSARS